MSCNKAQGKHTQPGASNRTDTWHHTEAAKKYTIGVLRESVLRNGKQKSKLSEHLYFRKQYPSHKQWHLFRLMYYWAVKLSVSINQSDYSTCNKLKKSEHVYSRCTKKDYKSNVTSFSLYIRSLKKPFSFHLFFSSENHSYSANSTCYALATCKWKTEMMFIKTGKLKQNIFIMPLVQSKTACLPPLM